MGPKNLGIFYDPSCSSVILHHCWVGSTQAEISALNSQLTVVQSSLREQREANNDLKREVEISYKECDELTAKVSCLNVFVCIK